MGEEVVVVVVRAGVGVMKGLSTSAAVPVRPTRRPAYDETSTGAPVPGPVFPGPAPTRAAIWCASKKPDTFFSR